MPGTVTAGESVTLQWSSSNANNVTIEPGIGAVAANGTRQVMPNASVTYSATATGPGGNANATARVTVNQPPPPPPPPPPPAGPSAEELFRMNVVPIYFDYDESVIRQDQVARLQGNVRYLQQNANIQFTIGGHADERGTQEYNIGLGDRRANTVRQFMIDNGIAAGRINVISYGEERPTCTASNEACWGQNRRAEFAMR
jgi:peptidoglycan-associated lipoprotein